MLLTGAVSAQVTAPQVTPSSAATTTPAAPKVITSEVTRKGRPGLDSLIATYLVLDRDCKIGADPKIDTIEAPKGGAIRTRPQPINLRDVPGAPRKNCIGTSPRGVGIFYRAERKFRGDDRAVVRVTYPNGDTRVITVTFHVP